MKYFYTRPTVKENFLEQVRTDHIFRMLRPYQAEEDLVLRIERDCIEK